MNKRILALIMLLCSVYNVCHGDDYFFGSVSQQIKQADAEISEAYKKSVLPEHLYAAYKGNIYHALTLLEEAQQSASNGDLETALMKSQYATRIALRIQSGLLENIMKRTH